jgi:hypothetical protein
MAETCDISAAALIDATGIAVWFVAGNPSSGVGRRHQSVPSGE